MIFPMQEELWRRIDELHNLVDELVIENGKLQELQEEKRQLENENWKFFMLLEEASEELRWLNSEDFDGYWDDDLPDRIDKALGAYSSKLETSTDVPSKFGED